MQDVRALNELAARESAFVDGLVTEVGKVIVGQTYMVERILIGHLVVAKERGVMPFEAFPAAPPRYWQMFEQATIHLHRDRVPFRLPPDVLGRVPLPEVRLAEPALA